MIKTIVMALLIFAGMVAYDSATSKPTPTAPPTKQEQQQQEKLNKHEKSAAMALFVSLLPDRKTWPSPMQKFYLAFNMEEVIDPIRQNPQWTPLKSMSQE